jgi:two-component system, OmpR family, sensor kinase
MPPAPRRSNEPGAPWSGSSPTERILKHLAEIGAGRCSITEEAVVREPDSEMRQVLLGLLVLSEDLSYASERRSESESALRLVASERERLLEDRRRAVAARDEFIAVAAHELRTPLTTLTLVIDHLIAPVFKPTSDSGLVPVQMQHLLALKRQVDRLTVLAGEMLDVSRITSGRGLSLRPGPVDLRDVVLEVVSRFDLEIQRRRVTVVIDAPDPVPGIWDAARVDQVVTNLLSNALKYGLGRPIEVSIRSETSRAVLVVRDHGIGISQQEQAKILGPFAHAVAARHHEGLGLGLWIAQEILNASGGRITLDSMPGEGSTFTVELPV